jgi:hypothetical protein
MLGLAIYSPLKAGLNIFRMIFSSTFMMVGTSGYSIRIALT